MQCTNNGSARRLKTARHDHEAHFATPANKSTRQPPGCHTRPKAETFGHTLPKAEKNGLAGSHRSLGKAFADLSRRRDLQPRRRCAVDWERCDHLAELRHDHTWEAHAHGGGGGLDVAHGSMTYPVQIGEDPDSLFLRFGPAPAHATSEHRVRRMPSGGCQLHAREYLRGATVSINEPHHDPPLSACTTQRPFKLLHSPARKSSEPASPASPAARPALAEVELRPIT